VLHYTHAGGDHADKLGMTNQAQNMGWSPHANRSIYIIQLLSTTSYAAVPSIRWYSASLSDKAVRTVWHSFTFCIVLCRYLSIKTVQYWVQKGISNCNALGVHFLLTQVYSYRPDCTTHIALSWKLLYFCFVKQIIKVILFERCVNLMVLVFQIWQAYVWYVESCLRNFDLSLRKVGNVIPI
jgi:hypothetical protein